MAIQTRNSSLSVMVESTEGTPVAPSGATDYVALQDDFTMSPDFELLENAELKASLGKSKSITGAENPTASFSHYLRHSGVEGTAPNYKEILEAIFGTETVDASEEVTDSGSTTSVIALTANGSDHPRGSALLIKDGTNGRSIRPVHSQSSENLTLGFDIANAPAAGVGVGKCVMYSPADSGHQTLSLWHYIGSSGAIEMMSGVRVTEMGLTFPAGELINANYSFEGLKYYFNPIAVTSSDNKLDFTDDNGTFATSVTAQMYRDPHELAAAITSAMNSIQTAETHSCIYVDSTGKFTISTSTSAVLSILWKTGTSGADGTDEHIGTVIGFSDAADDTGSTSYVADTAQDWSTPYTPSVDDSDPLVAKANQFMIGDSDDTTCFQASEVSVTMSVPKTDIESVCADSGRSGSVPNERTVNVSVTALLEQHDVDKFRRYRANSDTRFCYIFGSKSGGEWVEGKCGCLYGPSATVTAFSIEDADGLVTLNIELETYVDADGNGEIYLDFV